MKNKLHFGDNLDILRKMDNECVDLICTDPPFNSGRNYNIFLPDSAYGIWTWDKAAEDARVDIEIKAASSNTYKALNECLRGYDIVLRNSDSAMGAYLAFMGSRLVEMHRILSKTGSMYLHCDPTVSHYLKCMMDAIFGVENFRNEIVWHYRRSAPASKQFHKMHDIILFYTKTNNYEFSKSSPVYENKIFIEDAVIEFMDEKPTRLKDGKGNSIRRRTKRDDALMHDVWDDISLLSSTSIERLDYPTQKPRRLYERMIKASSNEGDLVLDPFCGGGTTLDAAQALKRHWIGIDMTILALDPIKHRLKDRYGLKPSKDYEIKGYPTNMQDVKKLASDKTKDNEFSNWVVTRLGLAPAKDVDNVGSDGTGHFTLWTPKAKEKSDVRILAEVKTGKPTTKQVRAFRKSIEDNKAAIGIFITLEPIPSDMREIAEDMGKYEYKGLTYPRLQFWQITDEYFENPETIYYDLQLPGMLRVRPTKKTDHHFPDFQLEFDMK